MKLIIERDDKVYNLLDDRKGVVQSIYRELNKAIVKFDNSTEKVTLDNLVVIDDNSGENEDEDFLSKLIHKGKKLIHRLKR
jgi:tRNA(Ile2) C34 agmatinyltransferase TiaS